MILNQLGPAARSDTSFESQQQRLSHGARALVGRGDR